MSELEPVDRKRAEARTWMTVGVSVAVIVVAFVTYCIKVSLVGH